jgi:hypothetical protein
MRVTTSLALLRFWFLAVILACSLCSAKAQVSPAEIRNPELKSLEEAHLKQLMALNREIAARKFAFPFTLGRYVGLDPQQQAGIDTRGLEFVHFHERTILKISGNYNAAFNAERLTQNQRANRTFDDVVVPILQLLPKYFSGDAGFNSFGFEISYHVRTASRGYDYEGREILVVVFSAEDAARYPKAETDAERQQILNSSEVYVSGQEFGLALGRPEPLSLEEIGKPEPSGSSPGEKNGSLAPASRTVPARGGATHASLGLQLPVQNPAAPAAPGQAAPRAVPESAPLTQSEVDSLQKQYQPELDALAKEGAAKFHFAAYAPPSLVLFRNQLYLQVTLRNPAPFDKDKTSIYKRAAQSFDLFLAPLLKDLVAKTSPLKELAGLDITVLNQLASGSPAASSSEATEYICSMETLRRFTEYEITNQELVNQSLVLVNGVRIALNLQQVE